jgi:hypothetical protein
VTVGAGIAKCVVVVSHPRSGTHLTIDFVRRNFPSFRRSLPIWKSSSYLLYNLDAAVGPRNSPTAASASGALIVKTHTMSAPAEVATELAQVHGIGSAVFIYPYRRFSQTMQSFKQFSRFAGRLEQFVASPDAYFRQPGASVGETAKLHAANWLSCQQAWVLSVESLLDHPDRTVQILGDLLDEVPVPVRRRLPGRKPLGGGKIGELMQRLYGRESTEVRVRWGQTPQDLDEARRVDEFFGETYDRLTARSIN